MCVAVGWFGVSFAAARCRSQGAGANLRSAKHLSRCRMGNEFLLHSCRCIASIEQQASNTASHCHHHTIQITCQPGKGLDCACFEYAGFRDRNLSATWDATIPASARQVHLPDIKHFTVQCQTLHEGIPEPQTPAANDTRRRVLKPELSQYPDMQENDMTKFVVLTPNATRGFRAYYDRVEHMLRLYLLPRRLSLRDALLLLPAADLHCCLPCCQLTVCCPP